MIILLSVGSHDLFHILLLHASFHRNIVLLGQRIAVCHTLSYLVLHLSQLIVHYHGVHVINHWLLRDTIEANVVVGSILVLIVEEGAFWDRYRLLLLLIIVMLLVILLPHLLLLHVILISHLLLLLLLVISTIGTFVILHLLWVKHALFLLLVAMALLVLLTNLLTLRPRTIDLVARWIEHHRMLLLLLLLLLHLLLLLVVIHWDQHRIAPIDSSLLLHLLLLMLVLVLRVTTSHDYLRGVLGRIHRGFHTIHAVWLLDILHVDVRVTIRRISIMIVINIDAVLA